MRSVITQSVVLPASAASLFDMYLDPQVHEAITGASVTIGSITGSDFKAFDGILSGTVLGVVRSSLIVQSWRSAKFNLADPESTLILSFQPEGANGRIDLVHLDVPALQRRSRGLEKVLLGSVTTVSGTIGSSVEAAADCRLRGSSSTLKSKSAKPREGSNLLMRYWSGGDATTRC